MNTNCIFMIVNDKIIFLDNPTTGHSEWYGSLGLVRDEFINTVIGAVVSNKIVFYKSDLSYDDKVIDCAKKYGLDVMKHINNFDVDVCCGVLLGKQSGDWEPIYTLNGSDIEGYIQKERALTRVEKGNDKTDEEIEKEKIIKENEEASEVVELGRDVIEYKNDYLDDKFINKTIKNTLIVLVLNIIVNTIWMMIYPSYNTSSSKFLIILTTILMIISIIFFKSKKSSAKILATLSSALIVFNFNFLSIILGIYYFVFIVDENLIKNVVKIIKDTFNKIKKNKK